MSEETELLWLEVGDYLTRVIESDNVRRGFNAWPLQHDDIRRLLIGNTKKLPKSAVPAKLIGNVTVYCKSQEDAQRDKPKSIRPHRVYAICPDCAHHVPAGRLWQHRHMNRECNPERWKED